MFSSEPRPLRRKELLDMPRSPANLEEPRTPEMGGPCAAEASWEVRPLRSKEFLEWQRQMWQRQATITSRSASASKIGRERTPEHRQRTCLNWSSIPNRGEPLRPKEFLEPLRSRYLDGSAAKLANYPPLSTPVSSQDTEELLKTPLSAEPSMEFRPLRTKEFLERQRQKNITSRSASASKIGPERHLEDKFLTPEHRQRTWEEPRTPDMRGPCSAEPSIEFRPLRTKELLERERQVAIASRSASASKIGPQRTKAAAPASSFTTSRLLVPSIGFSYPKDPKTCPTSTSSKKPPSKLTNTKRNLFHHEALRQKLERITEQWQRMTEQQLRHLILDFVNLCLPSSGAKCSHLSGACDVSQLMEALQQLRYPKKVNKTWLWMPNSQKAIGHVLEILHFLLDFVEDSKEESEGICVFPIVPGGKQIFQQAASAFSSSQGCTEQKLESSAEASRTSYELISLQQELENLNIQPENPGMSSELYSLQQEKRRLQEELANCRAEIKSSAAEYTDNLQKIGHLCMTNLAKGRLLAKLKDRVRNQSCRLEDYGKLLDQQLDLTHELQLHRLRLQEFAERQTLCKLKLRRSQKEQKESIEAFNVHVRDYEYSLASKSVFPESLQLSTNATLPEIEEIIERLKALL